MYDVDMVINIHTCTVLSSTADNVEIRWANRMRMVRTLGLGQSLKLSFWPTRCAIPHTPSAIRCPLYCAEQQKSGGWQRPAASTAVLTQKNVVTSTRVTQNEDINRAEPIYLLYNEHFACLLIRHVDALLFISTHSFTLSILFPDEFLL